MRPSSGTTRPSAPAALTPLLSQLAISVGLVGMTGAGTLLRGNGGSLLVDHAEEGVHDLGIELARPLTVDFCDRFRDRPQFRAVRRGVHVEERARVNLTGERVDEERARELLAGGMAAWAESMPYSSARDTRLSCCDGA